MNSFYEKSGNVLKKSVIAVASVWQTECDAPSSSETQITPEQTKNAGFRSILLRVLDSPERARPGSIKALYA